MSSAAKGNETTIGLLITSNSGTTLSSGLLPTRLRRDWLYFCGKE